MPEPGPFGATPELTVVGPDGVELAIFRVLPASPPGPASAPDERPALLLVHGATADHTTWRAVGPAFAATRPTFALDRRGRGSSGDAADYAIEREYGDVAAAAEAIAAAAAGAGAAGAPGAEPGSDQGPRVDVVGHSYGGRVALGASLRTPTIRRLVVYEGAPVPAGMSYRPPGLVEAVRGALDRGDNEAALSTFLAGIVGMSESALAAYRADPVWPVRAAAAPTILREIEAEASPAASLDALGAVEARVLLILGSISRSPFRIGTDELALRLRDARVATIQGAAHAAHHTHAAEFVRVATSFLDSA